MPDTVNIFSFMPDALMSTLIAKVQGQSIMPQGLQTQLPSPLLSSFPQLLDKAIQAKFDLGIPANMLTASIPISEDSPTTQSKIIQNIQIPVIENLQPEIPVPTQNPEPVDAENRNTNQQVQTSELISDLNIMNPKPESLISTEQPVKQSSDSPSLPGTPQPQIAIQVPVQFPITSEIQTPSTSPGPIPTPAETGTVNHPQSFKLPEMKQAQDIVTEPAKKVMAEPIKIPLPPDIAPAPIQQGGLEMMAAAGPRESLFASPKAQNPKEQIRTTEEAALKVTEREVAPKLERPIDWFNDVFRKPVSDLTRDGFRFLERKDDVIFNSPSKLRDDASPILRNDAPSKPDNEAMPKRPEPIGKPDPKPVSSPERTQQQQPSRQHVAQLEAILKRPLGESILEKSIVNVEFIKPQPMKTAFVNKQSVEQNPKSDNPAPVKPVENKPDIKPEPVKNTVEDTPIKAQPMDNRTNGDLVTPKVSIKSAVEIQDNQMPVFTSAQVNTAPRTINTVEIPKAIHILDTDTPIKLASEIKLAESNVLSTNGQAVLRIELKPPRLGTLEIELVRDQSGMDVKLVARTALAREILTQRGDEIRQTLVDHGIVVKKFEIASTYRGDNFANHDSSSFSQNGNSYRRGGDESPNPWGNTPGFNNLNPESQVDDSELSQSDETREYHGLNLLI